MNTPNGGPFDCCLPGCYPRTPQTAADPHPWPNSITVHPSIMEQMGVDPISKLAAAIEKLAAALEGAKQ